MKIRQGFVSNSSSSSFILDLREDGVKELLEEINVPDAYGLGRFSSKAIGKDAVSYAKEWLDDMGDFGCDEYSLGAWIIKWAEELGEDNVVFLRESDEDDGLFGEYDYDGYNIVESPHNNRIKELYEKFQSKVKDEREYH